MPVPGRVETCPAEAGPLGAQPPSTLPATPPISGCLGQRGGVCPRAPSAPSGPCSQPRCLASWPPSLSHSRSSCELLNGGTGAWGFQPSVELGAMPSAAELGSLRLTNWRLHLASVSVHPLPESQAQMLSAWHRLCRQEQWPWPGVPQWAWGIRPSLRRWRGGLSSWWGGIPRQLIKVCKTKKGDDGEEVLEELPGGYKAFWRGIAEN